MTPAGLAALTSISAVFVGVMLLAWIFGRVR